MERIASFCVDHTKLDRGMYLSRQDGDVLTWDIRMKKPNRIPPSSLSGVWIAASEKCYQTRWAPLW